MSGNNRLYGGPSDPPVRPKRPHESYKERKLWYDMSGVRPQPQSPGEIELRRRALGLSGPVRRAQAVVEIKFPIESAPEPGAHDVQNIRDWTRHYIFHSFIVFPLGPVANVGRVNGRHGNLDWAGALSADCECEHGRLKGDPCPQPVLSRVKNSENDTLMPPQRQWPFTSPCWCFGEPGAITPEDAAGGLKKLSEANARELLAWKAERAKARELKRQAMSRTTKAWRARGRV